MKIKTVTVELGRKRTVNYQSSHNSVGFTAAVGDDDDPAAVVRELQRKAAELLLKMETPKRRAPDDQPQIQQDGKE